MKKKEILCIISALVLVGILCYVLSTSESSNGSDIETKANVIHVATSSNSNKYKESLETANSISPSKDSKEIVSGTNENKETNETDKNGETKEMEEVYNTGNEYSFPPSDEEILEPDKFKKRLDNKDVMEQIDNNIDTTVIIDSNGNEYRNSTLSVNPDKGTQDVKVGVSVMGIKSGLEANMLIEQYNSTHGAKYLIECEEGWENVIIPLKLDYIEEVSNENVKIEPNISICDSTNIGITYRGENYTPEIYVIYTSKSVKGREGYIVTKLPYNTYKENTLKMIGWNADVVAKIKL